MLALITIGLATAVPPAANPGSWWITDRLVTANEQSGDKGSLSFELTSGGTQPATRCRVSPPSGNEKLDEQACAFLVRVWSVAPWRNPGPGPVKGSLQWSIERIAPEPDILFPIRGLPATLDGKTLVMTLDINSVGRAVGCELLKPVGDQEIDTTACARARTNLRFARADEGRGRSRFATVLRNVRLRALPRTAAPAAIPAP